MEDWLSRETLHDDVPGPTEQGGVFGYTLCEEDNRRSGRYATEYGSWASTCMRLLLEDVTMTPTELDQRAMLLDVIVRIGGDDGAMPSAFTRQVLASMCSIAAPWHLATRFPAVRDLVLSDEPGELPDGMALSMGLFLGPSAFFAGPSLQVDLPTHEWRWLSVMAFPPFAFELVLAADWHQPQALCGVAHFLSLPARTRGSVEFQMPVLFSHTMFPGDWRNTFQIENHLDIYGRPE